MKQINTQTDLRCKNSESYKQLGTGSVRFTGAEADDGARDGRKHLPGNVARICSERGRGEDGRAVPEGRKRRLELLRHGTAGTARGRRQSRTGAPRRQGTPMPR